MADVLLNTADIVVFGPPEVVDLLVDVGPQGIRGNKIFSGNGDPRDPTTILPSEPIQLNDMFLDISSSGGSYLYQYLNDPALGDIWTPIVKVSPILFAKNYSLTFATGTVTKDIPLSEILPDATSSEINAITSADTFNVQFNIVNSLPIASSVTKSIQTISSVKNLRLVFRGVSFTGSTATNLTGAQSVQVFVSVVTP